MEGSFPLDHEPVYSRRIDDQRGGRRSYYWGDVVVSGEVWLPIPAAPIGHAVIQHRPFEPWWNSDPVEPTYDVLGGGRGEVVCRPQIFHYALRVPERLWDEEIQFREMTERRIRGKLARALESRFPITMNIRAA